MSGENYARADTRTCFRSDCRREFEGMGMYVFVTVGNLPRFQRGKIQCLRHGGQNQYSPERFAELDAEPAEAIAPPTGRTSQKWFAQGYQSALADIQRELSLHGATGVEAWLRNNVR